MLNAGKYNKKIQFYERVIITDSEGFQTASEQLVLTTYASVKTTRGFTLIANGSDFEKAYTNFTIRYPVTTITRDMTINFKGKRYSIEYLNNINSDDVELEVQAKEISK